MKLNVVFLGFLMLVVLTYSQKTCQKEEKKIWYYVYRTNVEIKTYYCFHNPKSDFLCNSFYNAKDAEVKSKEIFRRCTFENAIKSSEESDQHIKHHICELPAHVDLLKGTVKLEDNVTCSYKHGYCPNKKFAKDVYWMKEDVCRRLLTIHKNYFNVWTLGHNQTKFIQNEAINLLLTEKNEFCGVEMWKTDNKGIIVSEDNATTLEIQSYPMLNSMPPKECNIQMEPKLIPRKPPTTWYLYKYPTNVTVSFCFTNSQDSCKNQNLAETVPKHNSNSPNQCMNYFDFPFDTDQVMVCKQSLKIDFEKNLVLGLSSDCTYSSGECRSNKAFWVTKDHCGVLHKIIRGYEESCNKTKCIISKDKPIKFNLIREGYLCGEKVWYSDQDGLLISKKELFQPEHLKTENNSESSIRDAIYKRRKEINNLQSLLNYIILFLVLCVAWYVLNVIINFCSLLNSKKPRPVKGKMYLINCVSQSLTQRYLLLPRPEKTAPKPVNIREPDLYASVNNELYQSTNA